MATYNDDYAAPAPFFPGTGMFHNGTFSPDDFPAGLIDRLVGLKAGDWWNGTLPATESTAFWSGFSPLFNETVYCEVLVYRVINRV